MGYGPEYPHRGVRRRTPPPTAGFEALQRSIAAPRAWSECQRARPQEKEPEKSSVTGAAASRRPGDSDRALPPAAGKTGSREKAAREFAPRNILCGHTGGLE